MAMTEIQRAIRDLADAYSARDAAHDHARQAVDNQFAAIIGRRKLAYNQVAKEDIPYVDT